VQLGRRESSRSGEGASQLGGLIEVARVRQAQQAPSIHANGLEKKDQYSFSGRTHLTELAALLRADQETLAGASTEVYGD